MATEEDLSVLAGSDDIAHASNRYRLLSLLTRGVHVPNAPRSDRRVMFDAS
jgi:hypothetical protein